MKKILLYFLVCMALIACCAPKNTVRPKLKDIKIEQPVRPMYINMDTVFTKIQVDSLRKVDSLDYFWHTRLVLPTYPTGCYYQEIFVRYIDSVTVKYSILQHSQDTTKYFVTRRIE